MDEGGLVQTLLYFVESHHQVLGPVVVFMSSLIEYVFPPFPGDAITLFGTYLVVKGLWSFSFAMALTVAGSLVGATMDYGIGRWLANRSQSLPSQKDSKKWTPLTRESFEKLSEKFKKYGPAYISINRFLPGIRAFFFVAAGASRMKLWQVLFFATISALAWNGLILGVGYSIGSNWHRFRDIFSTYTTIAWIVLAAVAICVMVLWFIKKRRPQHKKG